jgi:hypothetical protein
MRLFFCILTLSVVFFPAAFGQSGPAASQNSPEAMLKEQAHKMGQAFIQENYKLFAVYTYPQILSMMGGPDKLAEQLTKIKNDLKSKGMSFSKIEFGESSKIVRNKTELQATIPQLTEIKLAQGRVVATSTLIAISTDGGKRWAFVDTSNKDMATIRKMLPNLSGAITIPPPQPPVKYDK